MKYITAIFWREGTWNRVVYKTNPCLDNNEAVAYGEEVLKEFIHKDRKDLHFRTFQLDQQSYDLR